MSTYSVQASKRPEHRLLEALKLIQSAQPSAAEDQLKKLIDDESEFKLAHMLYADLLKSRAAPLEHAGMGLSADEELQQLLNEVKKRWQASKLDVEEQNKIPAVLP